VEKRKKIGGMEMSIRMLLSNNSRKMAGLPLRRKKNSKKRWYTRCEADETITAFIAAMNV